MKPIPKEHQLECPKCEVVFDMRDLGQAMSHGFGDCKPIEIPYSKLKKIGDSVEWTKDKKRIDLN